MVSVLYHLVQDTSVLTPGMHIGLILTLAFIIFKKSSTQLFQLHPCLYILTFGMVIAKISNKLVVGAQMDEKLLLMDKRLQREHRDKVSYWFSFYLNVTISQYCNPVIGVRQRSSECSRPICRLLT